MNRSTASILSFASTNEQARLLSAYRKGKILWLIMIVLLCSSCSKQNQVEVRVLYSDEELCEMMNSNVLFMRMYLDIYQRDTSIQLLSHNNAIGEVESMTIEHDGKDYTFYNLATHGQAVPQLRIAKNVDEYIWRPEDVGSLRPVAVDDDTVYPHYRIVDSTWQLSMDGRYWRTTRVSNGSNSPHVSISDDRAFLTAVFGNGVQQVVPTQYVDMALKHGVAQQAFYKDVFFDAGVGLTSRATLAVFDYTGCSVERVTCTKTEDSIFQNTIIGGEEDDINGHLLYPDGSPRFRTLVVGGGKATTHGQSLNRYCHSNVSTYVRNGGSYLGFCAGAFLASQGSSATSDINMDYFGLWQGKANSTGVANSKTTIAISKGSALLNSEYLKDIHYIDNVRHNGGGYAYSWTERTEILATYDCAQYPAIDGQPVAWASKRDDRVGRVVMMMSHPETSASIIQKKLTAALLEHASEGVGETRIKGLLRNGETRKMNKSTADNDPDYTMIGDRQVHHFAAYIPDGAHNIHFIVSSETDCDLLLTVAARTYAYSDAADYMSSSQGNSQAIDIDNLTEGLYYVAVQQLTTVTAQEEERGHYYSGRTDLLNGVPYSISVRWEVD